MIIFHHNDQDGYIAANLAYNAYRKNCPTREIRFQALNYENPFPIGLIKPDEFVIIVDYSFDSITIHVFDDILKITNNIHWIDHHMTSIKALQEPENAMYDDIPGIRNDKYCATMLTYFAYIADDADLILHKLINNEAIDLDSVEIPSYIRMTDDFDCWKNTSTDVMDLAICMRTVEDPLDPMLQNLYIAAFKKSDRKDNNILMDLCSAGHSINEYLKVINADQLKDNGFEATIVYEVDEITRRIHVLALNANGNSTLFGDEINNYDAVVVFTYNGNTKRYTHSIFSKVDGANCREVAEYFGGGGHDHAAGFTTSSFLFEATDMYM